MPLTNFQGALRTASGRTYLLVSQYNELIRRPVTNVPPVEKTNRRTL